MKIVFDYCNTQNCSNSKRKSPVASSQTNNTCKDCNPTLWTQAANFQKETWLKGENLQ